MENVEDDEDYGDDEATTELIHRTFGDEYFYRVAALLAGNVLKFSKYCLFETLPSETEISRMNCAKNSRCLLTNSGPEATAEIERIFNQTKELYVKNNWIGIPKSSRTGKLSATGKQSELVEVGDPSSAASNSTEGRPISSAKVEKSSPKRESVDSVRDGSSSVKRTASSVQLGKQQSKKISAEPILGLEFSDNDEGVPSAKKPATTIVPAPITKFEELLNLSASATEGGGTSCALCKESSSSANNVLVECQECHSHYHQRCHEPAISNSQINDPRVVWYCEKCSNKLKNLAASKTTTSTVVAQSQPKVAKPIGQKKDPVASLAFKKAAEARTVTNAGPGTNTSSTVDKKAEISSKFADFLAKQKASKKLASPTNVNSSANLPTVFPAATIKPPITNAQGIGKLAPASAIVKAPPAPGLSAVSSQQPFATKSLPPTAPKTATAGGSSSTTAMESAEKRLMQMKKKAAQKQADRGAH